MKLQKNSLKDESFNSQEYSLIIRGHNLNFEEIELEFGVEGKTKAIRKGEIISKFIGKSEKDVYIYTEECDEGDERLEMLFSFLEKLLAKKEMLKVYSSVYDVVIRIFLQSSQAQMFFFVNQDILKMIGELNLPIELSVFSWGGV